MTDELAEKIVEHIESIRAASWQFENATFVINCEANTAYASPSVDAYFRKHAMDFDFDVVTFRTQPGNNRSSRRQNPDRAITVRPGLWTSNETKAEQVVILTRLLRRQRIRFHANFTSSPRDPREIPKGYEDVRGAIQRQLSQFTRTTYPPKAGDEMRKYGKVTYEGKEQDDFVLSLLSFPWTVERSRTSTLLQSHIKEKPFYSSK